MEGQRPARPWVSGFGAAGPFVVKFNLAFAFQEITLAGPVGAGDLARGEDYLHPLVAAEIGFGPVIPAGRHDQGIGTRFAQSADVLASVGDGVRLLPIPSHDRHPLRLRQHVMPLCHRCFGHRQITKFEKRQRILPHCQCPGGGWYDPGTLRKLIASRFQPLMAITAIVRSTSSFSEKCCCIR